MITDVNTFLGNYPFRRVPGTSPEALLTAMTRVGITEAWVSHLPGLWWRNPAEGNHWLYETTRRFPVCGRFPRCTRAFPAGKPRWRRRCRTGPRRFG